MRTTRPEAIAQTRPTVGEFFASVVSFASVVMGVRDGSAFMR